MEPIGSKIKNLANGPKYKPADIIHSLGKIPPQALDIEEAVLGALLIEKDALTNVVDILRPQSFYKEAHQRIYAAIITLFDKTEPIDLLTVTNQLRTTGELELAGGAFYLVELTSRVNSAANIEYHARIIIEQAIKRELIGLSTEIQKDSFEYTTDVFELLDRAGQKIFDITESNIRKSFSSVRDVMRQAIAELEAKKDHTDGLTGVPSGFSALDRMTSGWQKSDLLILAARPGMGKTAFVLSFLRNAAVDHKVPIAIFSLEMSSIQLVNRLIAGEAELDSQKIRKGNLADYEWAQLHHKIAHLSEAPIFIDDTPGLSILELRAKCRRLKQKYDIQMIIIDYLQLMTADHSGKGGGNREQEIAAISRALKNIAKELDVPVMALSQLSRQVEQRGGNKRPQLSDLRESGSIEQDADMVMFLYRPEYYEMKEYEDGSPADGTAEIMIAKHRNGSLDNVRLKYIGKYTKFADLDYMESGSGSPFPVSNFFASEDTNQSEVRTFGSKLNNLGSAPEEEDFVPF